MRVDRAQVLRIELDEERRGGDDRRDDRGRPSGLRERDLSVDSWTAWKDTGVEVRAGQTIYFSASGRVRWGPNRQDGPEGERNSPRNDQRPMPNRPSAGLTRPDRRIATSRSSSATIRARFASAHPAACFSASTTTSSKTTPARSGSRCITSPRPKPLALVQS